MRSYTATLLFEQAIDFVAPSAGDVYTAIQRIFNPSVPIIEEDCGTLLGERLPLSMDLIGRLELQSNTLVTKSRLNQAVEDGVEKLNIRSLSSCISKGGICQSCYVATNTGVAPAIGTYTTVPPRFILQTEHQILQTGTSETTISYAPEEYDLIRVYVNGSRRVSGTGYTLDGKTLTLTPAIPAEPGSDGLFGTLTVRYFVETMAPYVYWLGTKFSGSLLGLAALPTQRFPIRKDLMASVLPVGDVEYLVDRVMTSPLTPAPVKSYLPNITDPLEKAVFVALLASIFIK